jgi:hypothetical protein
VNDNLTHLQVIGCGYRCEACGMHVVDLTRSEPPGHGICCSFRDTEHQFGHDPTLLLEMHMLAHGGDLAELRRLTHQGLPSNVVLSLW